MHSFRVESFVIRHLEQPGQNGAANLRRAGKASNPETIAATGYFDVEAAFDLPQVLIKLTAKIGKAVVIGRFENDVARNLDSTQNLNPKPLCRKLPVRTTGALPKAAINLSKQ
jgi:hypothetical protein